MTDHEKTAPSTPARGTDPLRGSRTSATWVAVSLLVVLMLLLVIFIGQNTQNVQVSFFGWEGEPPLAVALLIAATVGMGIAFVAGGVRILQLRRHFGRER